MMWSETVGLLVLGQDRSETKISVLVLALQVWCCVVKHVLVTLVVIMILKDSNFSSTIYSFAILVLKQHYCGDQ